MKNNVSKDIEEALGRASAWQGCELRKGLDLKYDKKPWINQSVIHGVMHDHWLYVIRNSQTSALFLPETINRIIDRSQRQQKRETLYDLLRRILSRTTTYFLGD